MPRHSENSPNRNTVVHLAQTKGVWMFETYFDNSADVLDYLQFSAQFPQLTAHGCAQLYFEMPKATLLATAQEYENLGIELQRDAKGKGVEVQHIKEVDLFYRQDIGEVEVKDASPQEQQAIADGRIGVYQRQAIENRLVYDVSQTNCTTAMLDKLTAQSHLGATQPEVLYQQMVAAAESSGITVVEKPFDGRHVHGFYSAQDNAIHINSKINAAERLHTMCRSYSQALVETTSTQNAPMKAFESEALNATICSRYGIPMSDRDMHWFDNAHQAARSQGNMNYPKSLERLQKMTKFTFERMDVAEKIGQAPMMEQMQQMAQAQAQVVSTNFMQNL